MKEFYKLYKPEQLKSVNKDVNLKMPLMDTMIKKY